METDLRIRVSEETKENLTKKAKELGLSLSAYVRLKLNVVKEGVDTKRENKVIRNAVFGYNEPIARKNIAIGYSTVQNFPVSPNAKSGISNCVAIGIDAGINLTNENGVVIIGDNIKDLNPSQENVTFIGDKIAIGETIKGEKFNLREILNKLITNK